MEVFDTLMESIKKTREEVAQEVLDKHNGNIELVGDYLGALTKTMFHCNICGNDWEAKPNNILSGKGCPKCGVKSMTDSKRKTTEQVSQEVLDKHEGRIELVGDYMNNHTNALFHCNVCGNEWETRPNSVLQGHGCPRCANMEKRTKDQVAKEISYRHEGRISLVGDYVDTSTKTLFHCNVCGNEWEARPNSVLQGHGCPRCVNKGKKTRDQVAQEIYDGHGGKVELKGDYVNNQTNTLFHCNTCGTEWMATPKNVLDGHGCPRCASSHGEDYISSWLEKNWSRNDWSAQKKFKDLRGTGNGFLSYDFYIPSKNLCIEFQGIQHYVPTKFHSNMNAEAQFINQQEHDRRKKQYCQEHGITLLEIRHDEIDMIDDILDKALNS